MKHATRTRPRRRPARRFGGAAARRGRRQGFDPERVPDGHLGLAGMRPAPNGSGPVLLCQARRARDDRRGSRVGPDALAALGAAAGVRTRRPPRWRRSATDDVARPVIRPRRGPGDVPSAGGRSPPPWGYVSIRSPRRRPAPSPVRSSMRMIGPGEPQRTPVHQRRVHGRGQRRPGRPGRSISRSTSHRCRGRRPRLPEVDGGIAFITRLRSELPGFASWR